MKFKKKKLLPEGTDELVDITDIEVPHDYIIHPPRKSKVNKALNYLRENGVVDVPISVIPETNERGLPNKLILFDEYTRYLALVKTGSLIAPVKYI